MRRPTKKELLIPATVAVAVIFVAVVSQALASPSFTGGPASMNEAAVPASSLFQFGQSFSANRVVKTNQGITGQINTATQFENVTLQIQIITDSLSGYEQQEVLNFANNQWTGNWVINLPTNSATTALTRYTDLIQRNGQVNSISIQVEDVTNQTGGNQSLVQWSPLSISLQQVQPPQSGSPFSGAIALLETIGIDAAYVGLIGVPTYFGVLAVFFVAKRGFAPLLYWVERVSRKSVQEKKLPT
jgi:hypothetical protein